MTDVPITAADKHLCAQRELRLRQRVYPARVREGKMAADQADREISIMRAIVADYAPRDLFGGDDG